MNTNVRARSCAHLFPPSKWAGLFPFAAYRRSAPPQLVQGGLKWRCLGCFGVVWMALQRRKTGLFFLHGWRCIYSAHASWDVSTWIGYFCNTKGQRGFISTLAFIASRRACRPKASFPIQLARSRIEPASREARRRAAAISQSSCMSPEHPARLRRAVRGAGVLPLLEEDTDHAAVAFVDDLAESLLYFLLGVYGHPHQLVGKPLPDQFVQALAEEVRVPNGLGIVLEFLQ